MVPIRSIGEAQRGRVAQHLLALDAHDRYLRFGYAASDAQVQAYVDRLNFERDEIYGIYNRQLALIAMAHLALADEPQAHACAEFGVSVLAHARGRGYGARLFERAVVHARNAGVALMFIHALTENKAMLKIALRAGARIERDGAEADAYLMLPPATFDSMVSELVQERLGETDYRLKQQARVFRNLLAQWQELRQGATAARHQSGQ